MLKLLCIAGFFASGFLRVPKVLIEWLVIMWLLLSPYFTMAMPGPEEPKTSSRLLKWVLKIVQSKVTKLKEVLHSENPGRAIAHLLLTAVALGCVLAFLRIMIFYNLEYVLAYEIVEISLDAIVFIPAFFMIRKFFVEQFEHIERRQEEEQKQERELREWEDQVLENPEDHEDSGATIVNVVPHWGTTSPSDRIMMKYFLYPSNRDIREDPIEAGREEMDWNTEQLYKEELKKAKSTRLTFGLIGLLPFIVGWWFSIGRFVDAPKWLVQLLLVAVS